MVIADVNYAKTADDVYIAYAVMGKGPIDIVSELDAATYIDSDFEDALMIPWYQEIASFSRLVILDRRGIGLSSRHVRPPNLETRVSDIKVVLDAIGAIRPLLLGAFEACASGALLAASEPDRVRTLIWIEPIARSIWTPDYPWGFEPADVEADRKMIDVWGTLEYGRRFVQHEASRDNQFGEDQIAVMAKSSRNLCTPDVALELANIWYDTDIRTILPSVQTPTLLLFHGGRKNTVEESNYIASQMPNATVKTMPGAAWSVGEMISWANEIRRFIGASPPVIDLDTVLTTVLFTDIVASTETQATLGDHAWKEMIGRHHAIVREALQRYRGTENDTAGDGFYATFDGPARAITCALEIVEHVRDLGLQVRAGVHTGECEFADGKYSGLSVTIGARVMANAGPSQVLVSRTVKDLVAGSGFAFEHVGERQLKGIPGRWDVFQVSAP